MKLNDPASNPVEDELDAIRIKLYEQTKDMTPEEQTVFFRKLAQEAFAKHGITPRYADIPPARQQIQP